MTTFLYSTVAAGPDGLTLALISISVVFCALLLIWGIYSLSGWIFTRLEEGTAEDLMVSSSEPPRSRDFLEQKVGKGLERRRGLGVSPSKEDETAAAIGIALQRYMEENMHDSESYIITVRHDVYERI